MVHSLVSKPAPTFTSLDTNGETYNFTAGGGRPTVLFFFPQAGSFACNRQVCQLQTLSEKESFKQANVQMVGVSADSMAKQKAFAAEKNLTYPILSDEDGKIRKLYGIGKFLIWPSTRTTFVMDKNGIVRAVLEASMNYGAHAKFAQKQLDKLEAEEKVSVADSEQPAAALDLTAISGTEKLELTV